MKQEVAGREVQISEQEKEKDCPLVQVEIGGRNYAGSLNTSMSFRIREENVPALEKKLEEWAEELGPGSDTDEV